jgi:hypothetical protein
MKTGRVATCFSLKKLLLKNKPYVYWTVHHLDTWIKIDQLDVACFIISLFTAQHVSDINSSILRSLRLICWVISCVVLLWYNVCWCYVVVWLEWCGVVWCGILMQAEAVLHYLLLNMFRMLVHPSSGACDLLWSYFMCCIALVRCVLVLRCGLAGVVWCGVVWYPYAGWSTSASSW